MNGVRKMVLVLCFTCLGSRAVNLKVCLALTTKEFLRSLRVHCFELGIPQLVLTDSGTQIVAGANLIKDFLNDPEMQAYFAENNGKPYLLFSILKGVRNLGA